MTLESSIAGSWYPDTASDIRALAGHWERSPGQEIAQPLQRPNVLILPQYRMDVFRRNADVARRRLSRVLVGNG